jgi:DNA-binding response OmpR family regulator
MRILLVENKIQSEKFIGAALKRCFKDSVSLECSPTLSQALDRLRDESFDAMVVDFSVPDLQGPDGLARVGAIAHRLTVIALVDDEERDRLMAARNLGICNWVTKETLTPSRLAAEVKSALAVHGPRGDV